MKTRELRDDIADKVAELIGLLSKKDLKKLRKIFERYEKDLKKTDKWLKRHRPFARQG